MKILQFVVTLHTTHVNIKRTDMRTLNATHPRNMFTTSDLFITVDIQTFPDIRLACACYSCGVCCGSER